MARKVRIEYAGAYYHILNRGNYRSWIFESEGARKSFLKCLREVCEAKGWRLHAWVLTGGTKKTSATVLTCDIFSKTDQILSS